MFGPETLRILLKQALRTNLKSGATTGSAKLSPVDLGLVERGLAPVLMELGPEHLDPIMEALGMVWHDGLRRVLLGYVERTLPGHERVVVDRLMTLEFEIARPLTRLLAKVGSPGALVALRRLAGCANVNLRCEALALLAPTPEAVMTELMRLVDDSDGDLRVAALRTLAHHQVRSAGPLLARRVQDASFHQLALDERREILDALFSLHPARAETLSIEMLQKHGLLADDSLEQTRAIVAELLGREARTMAALEAVLSATKRRWWNSASLRDAATSAAEAIAARLGKRITAAGEVQ
jgi:hypothetical protein